MSWFHSKTLLIRALPVGAPFPLDNVVWDNFTELSLSFRDDLWNGWLLFSKIASDLFHATVMAEIWKKKRTLHTRWSWAKLWFSAWLQHSLWFSYKVNQSELTCKRIRMKNTHKMGSLISLRNIHLASHGRFQLILSYHEISNGDPKCH